MFYLAGEHGGKMIEVSGFFVLTSSQTLQGLGFFFLFKKNKKTHNIFNTFFGFFLFLKMEILNTLPNKQSLNSPYHLFLISTIGGRMDGFEFNHL